MQLLDLVSDTDVLQILRLAEHGDMSVERLFSPFWGNIANEAVKNLLVKPQTSQLMADLLGISVSGFLLLTQSYSLPWLVLAKKGDVIQRIAEARKDANDWAVIMAPSNMVPILALLLIQSVSDMEVFIMSLLRSISTKFKDKELEELIRIEPASQALHLLKAAGEADESKKSRVCMSSFSRTCS